MTQFPDSIFFPFSLLSLIFLILIFLSHWMLSFLSFIHLVSPLTASALLSFFQLASALLSSSLPLICAFFISQFVSLPQLIIIFPLCSFSTLLLPLASTLRLHVFEFLTTSTTCVMDWNIASSGPCWTITMQSNPNRDVCRKQHVCNYCLMRPLSQAECPIKLPMRKRCQAPLKKKRRAKRERGEGGCVMEK